MTAFAIIGLGEVGSIFARDLHRAGAGSITGYDCAAEARDRAAAAGYVTLCETARDAAAGADVIFVAVTAGAVIEAMRSLPGGIAHHPFVVDVNSVSPATKRDADRIVTDAGGRYVEAAVMTSVPPHGIRSPMLLGGRHANDWLALMTPFAMRLEIFGEDIGGASSVKMCRSVMIKGLEALATECLLAARHHGVDRQVLASLADTLPHADWSGFARYLIGRALVHGKRRAEEMDEVARMLDDAGIEPMLSRAVARRQQWAFEQGSRLAPQHLSGRELGPLLDALAALRDEPAPDDARLAIEPRTA